MGTKRNQTNLITAIAGYFIDNTSGLITALKGRTALGDVVASFFNRLDHPEFISVSTSGATITLDLDSDRLKNFKGSAAIGAAKAIAFDNVGGAAVIPSFRFTLSGAYALTFPSNVKMSDVRWNSGTKVWTPLDAGDYEARMTYDGTNWYVTIGDVWN